MAVKYYSGNRLTGTASDRSGFTTTNLLSGSTFIETDTHDMYHWNGSAWNVIASDTVAQTHTNRTLTSPTITTPTIAATGWANATHTHSAANRGGQFAISNTTGTLAVARGGTGATSLNNLITLSDHTTGNYVATIAGTANEIEISGSGSEGAAVTIGIPTNPTLGGNVTVSGNLTVSGTTTTVSSTEIVVADPIVSLATTNTGNAVDIGFYGKYVSSGTKYTGLLWDANVSKYRLFHGNATEPTTTVDIAGSGHTASTLIAELEGNAATATALATARTIGGVSFNGTANINLPGVNAAGNQNTTGSAATLTTARTIGGVSFDGSANINLPGVNTAGNQNTSGTAAGLSATLAVASGGTGATTLNNLITLSTHTTGNYVATITGGTGITSSGATSGEGIAHSLSVDASQTQVTAVGTIGTGTWQADVIASAYLDADTAHLSGTQTFTGAKTFSSQIGIGTASPIPMTHIMANATTGTVPYPLLALELADGGADTNAGEGPAINFYIPDTTTDSTGSGTIYARKGAGNSHLAGQIATVRISVTDALGSGDMTFSTAANAGALVEAMRIGSDGYVGIATTDPDYPLHIRAANENLGMFKLEADMGTNNNRIFTISSPSTDSASEPFIINTSNAIAFQTDGTQRMLINSAGIVGIGNTAPHAESLLDVKNAATYTSTGNFIARIQQNTNASGRNGLSVMNAWAATASIIFEAAMGWNGSAVGYYPVYTIDGLGNHIWKGGSPAADTMKLLSSGNLGVGTTTPDYKIEAEGTGVSIFAHYPSHARGGIHTMTSGRVGFVTTSSADDIYLGYTDSAPANDGSDLTKRFSIDNALNFTTVGDFDIESAAPRSRLTVFDGGLSITGSVSAINATDGARHSIQLATDTAYGGTYDNHTGWRIHSEMPGGWGTATLNFSGSSNWGTYGHEDVLVLGQSESIFHDTNLTLKATVADTGSWLLFRNDDVSGSTQSTGIAWNFNNASTRYVEILVDYDVRATQGLFIHAAYPITMDATTQFNFDLAGTREMTLNAVGLGINVEPDAYSQLKVGGTSTGHYNGAVQLQPTLSGNSNSGTGIALLTTVTGVTSDNTHHFGTRMRYTKNTATGTQLGARTLYIESPVVNAGTLTNGYGIWVDAGSAATNNYAAYFNGKVDIVNQTSGVWLNVGPTTINNTTREGGIQLNTSAGSSDRSWGLWGDANNPRAFKIEYLGARGTAFGSGTTIATFDYQGNVTMSTVKLTGGSPGDGKVLTSDADGDATWQDAGGGGYALSYCATLLGLH